MMLPTPCFMSGVLSSVWHEVWVLIPTALCLRAKKLIFASSYTFKSILASIKPSVDAGCRTFKMFEKTMQSLQKWERLANITMTQIFVPLHNSVRALWCCDCSFACRSSLHGSGSCFAELRSHKSIKWILFSYLTPLHTPLRHSGTLSQKSAFSKL